MLETAEYLTNEPCNTTLIQNINYPSPIYEFFGIYTSNIDGCRIEFKNVTIKSIATVNVTATDEIVLSPDFWAKEGSNVTLSITPNTSSNAPSLVPQHSSQQSVDIYPNTINNSDELIPFENIFKVYPNPNNGCFKLELPIETNSNIEIRITDIAGSIVYQTSSYTKDICIPNAQQGIYILSIIYPDNKTVFKKIIVQ
ncbi:MAG: T9SS type A sorting domain-containing protein [Paludibacter sp.]|nr:T9SS type A sorting domain-containing protein [Paludibacter sp.]